MPQIRLDNLVAALASSVAEAEHSVRLNQIRNLRTFFDQENHPVTVELQMPKVGFDAEDQEYETLRVPLITLVNVTNMSIREMEIRFQTSLGDVEDPPEPEFDGPMAFGGDEDPPTVQKLGWSERDKSAIGASTGPSTSESGKASITLRVAQSEAPEGLARLIARLNRFL